MKKVLSLALLFLFIGALAFAGSGNNNYMVHNVPNWNQRADDNITNVLMEVWPKGLYADIELTLTLQGNNLTTSQGDSLQGILKFELPPNSFIHDSWLWLNDSIIISASIIERSKAIQIYSGYIQQRQDPSLLLKTGANTYQLNVFPITNTYARKVKITFSTLMTQKGDKAILSLPTDILCASQNKPDFLALIHTNDAYTTPGFTNTNFNNYVISTSNDLYLLEIPPTAYGTDRPLDLAYTTTNTPTLTIYPTNTNEGVYELKMPVENPTPAPRHLSIILDHRPTGQWGYSSVYSFAEIKKKLRTFLLTNCSPTDSFNVFYTHNNTVIQAYSGWEAITPSAVNSLSDNMPNTITSDAAKFKSLLETGIIFGQTKLSQEEHTILITNNSDYTSLPQASQLFTGVQNTVGTFTNKISVLNYATYTTSSYGSPILFNNFCATSGGTHFKIEGYFYDGYLGKYTYDMDVLSIMNGILNYMSGGYNSYNVTLPLSGFAYNSYNPQGTNKYYTAQPYSEIGKYYGTINTGNTTIEYAGQNGPASHQVTINTIDLGTKHQMRSWVNNYLLDLEGMNNSLLYSEILDSSIKNRVLCYETAFLALENGDTVSGDTIKVAASTEVENVNNKTITKVKAYPNPFHGSLTIESPEEIEEIVVYDITGRLAFHHKDLKSKTFTWNGQNNQGESLSEGVYFIKVRYKDKLETIKVVKM